MSHSPENPEEDRKALQLRLRKIAGQIKGIESMIAGDYECAEVLTQLVSARRAIKSLSEKIIHDHLEHCLEPTDDAAKAKRQLREVTQMLKRYVE